MRDEAAGHDGPPGVGGGARRRRRCGGAARARAARRRAFRPGRRERRPRPSGSDGRSRKGARTSIQGMPELEPVAVGQLEPRGVRAAEGDVRLRRARRDARRVHAAVVRAEDVVHGHEDELVGSRARRPAAQPAPAGRRALPPSSRRIARRPAAQRPVDLFLQLVQAIGRVPGGRPHARQQGRGGVGRLDALEREGERRVGVGVTARARARSRSASIGRAAAEALRLPRDLGAGAAPAGIAAPPRRRRGTAAGPSRGPRSRRPRCASRAPPCGRAAP